MIRHVNTIFIIVAGLMLIGAGAAMVFFPHVLHAKNGVTLMDDPNLLSEIRAPGGFLLVAGQLLCFSAFAYWAHRIALISIGLVYLPFGIARFFSMLVDGVPAASLVGVTAMELIVGVLAFGLAKASGAYSSGSRPASLSIKA